MEKWKVPKGYSFMEYHDNDDCVVFYYQNNCNPEDVKAYLIPKEKKAAEPVKTYEEGFIAGFSHNIKTVEALEERIKKAIGLIDLIIPELWNINNHMTYKLKDIRKTLKGVEKYEYR